MVSQFTGGWTDTSVVQNAAALQMVRFVFSPGCWGIIMYLLLNTLASIRTSTLEWVRSPEPGPYCSSSQHVATEHRLWLPTKRTVLIWSCCDGSCLQAARTSPLVIDSDVVVVRAEQLWGGCSRMAQPRSCAPSLPCLKVSFANCIVFPWCFSWLLFHTTAPCSLCPDSIRREGQTTQIFKAKISVPKTQGLGKKKKKKINIPPTCTHRF